MSKSPIKRMLAAPVGSYVRQHAGNTLTREDCTWGDGWSISGDVYLLNGLSVSVYSQSRNGSEGLTYLCHYRAGRAYTIRLSFPVASRVSLHRLAVAFAKRVEQEFFTRNRVS